MDKNKKNSSEGASSSSEKKPAQSTTPTTNGSSSKAAEAASGSGGGGGAMVASTPDSAKSVVLNVGGRRFEVLRKNLLNFPNSRLWKIVHANTMDEILRHCDRYKPGRDSEGGGGGGEGGFVPAEYYFDHNYTSFAEILDSYRTGHLHLPTAHCAYNTREDLAYWGIDELLVEPCCAVKYYPEIEICLTEIDTEETEKQREIEREKLEDFGPSLLGRTRKYLWNLFEYPSTSRGAQVGELLCQSVT